MRRLAQLHLRLSAPQKQQLHLLATQRHLSVSALVETAVTTLLTASPARPQEGALGRRLDRLQRQLEATQAQLDLLTEALAVFVRLYLATTVEIPAGQKSDAQRRGTRRYGQFLHALHERLAQEQRLMRDLERAAEHSSASPGAEEGCDG